MVKALSCRSCFSVLAVVAATSPALAAEPFGDWLTANGRAVIRVASCDDAVCGTTLWVKKPRADDQNPDPAKRNRSLIGVQILSGMKPSGDNRWRGEVYNAENGKTYLAYISLKKPDVLRIEGCVLGGLFCGGENWKRAECAEDLETTPAAETIPEPTPNPCRVVDP
jgi:uncharacterized protein (DUF2147 family)